MADFFGPILERVGVRLLILPLGLAIEPFQRQHFVQIIFHSELKTGLSHLSPSVWTA
jgi:hypothetical protein